MSSFENTPAGTEEASPRQWAYYLPRMMTHSSLLPIWLFVRSYTWGGYSFRKVAAWPGLKYKLGLFQGFHPTKLNSSVITVKEAASESVCQTSTDPSSGKVSPDRGQSSPGKYRDTGLIPCPQRFTKTVAVPTVIQPLIFLKSKSMTIYFKYFL